MDEIDLGLCALLMRNCRAPYSELSAKLGISVPSVHRRIRALIESKVISEFVAVLSLKYIKAIPIMISGKSEARSIDGVIQKLSKNKSVERAVFSSQNFVILDGMIKDISEQEKYIDFVRTAAEITKPFVVVGSTPQDGGSNPGSTGVVRELSSLDLKIADSLRKDPRRQIKEIAKETGISSKTVRRRLDLMIESGALEFTILWAPTFSTGITSFINIHVKPSADKSKIRGEVTSRFGSRMMGMVSAGNIPDLFICVAWSPTAQDHDNLTASLADIKGVDSVSSDILQTGRYFKSWRYDLIEELANPGKNGI